MDCKSCYIEKVITNFDGGFMEYGVEIKEGVEITATAFDTVIPHFSIVLTIAVILFAFSTMISWSYYGMQGWVFLFGKGKITDFHDNTPIVGATLQIINTNIYSTTNSEGNFELITFVKENIL